MKKILSILVIFLISNVYAGFFEGVQNPNGRPGLLSIKYSDISLKTSHGHSAIQFMNFDEEYADEPFNLEVTLPVTNFLTFSWGISPITSSFPKYESYKIDYEHTGPGGEAYNSFYNLSHDGNKIVFVNLKKINLELHIPLYKIWEK